MKKTLKKMIASAMSVTTLAVSITCMSANAYEDTASMVLRNVSGAPGNITNGELSINTKLGGGGKNYYTSYTFDFNSSCTVNVASTNAVANDGVSINKNCKGNWINNLTALYSYITFHGSLSGSGECGTWYVS